MRIFEKFYVFKDKNANSKNVSLVMFWFRFVLFVKSLIINLPSRLLETTLFECLSEKWPMGLSSGKSLANLWGISVASIFNCLSCHLYALSVHWVKNSKISQLVRIKGDICF